jgi:hypothetical protein
MTQRRLTASSTILFALLAWVGETTAAEISGQITHVQDNKFLIRPNPGITLREGDQVDVFVELPGVGEAQVATAAVSIMLSKSAIAEVQQATGNVKPGQKVRVISNANLAAKDPVSLFDGKSLQGWHTNGIGRWTVEEGAIVGRLPKGGWTFGHLISDARFGDFVLRVQFKFRGNTGFYVRGQETGADGMQGLQADFYTPKTIGCLTEILGHPAAVGLTVPNPVERLGEYYRPNDWNDLVVTVLGQEVACYVNDVNTAELSHYTARQKGVVAIQLFGLDDTEVRVRSISVQKR